MVVWINTTSSLLPGLCTRNKSKGNFKCPGREEEASDKYSSVQSPTFLLCLSINWLCSGRGGRVGITCAFRSWQGCLLTAHQHSAVRAGYPKTWNIHPETFRDGCLPPTVLWGKHQNSWSRGKKKDEEGMALSPLQKKKIQWTLPRGMEMGNQEQWQELCYRGAAGEADSDQHIFWISCTSIRCALMQSTWQSISAGNVLMSYTQSQTPKMQYWGPWGWILLAPHKCCAREEERRDLILI